jgi:hypothetical protein
MKTHVILTLDRNGGATLSHLLNAHPELLNFGTVLADTSPLRQLNAKLRVLRHRDAAYLDMVTSTRMMRRRFFACQQGRGLFGASEKPMGAVTSVGFTAYSTQFSRLRIPGYLRARRDIKVIGLIHDSVFDRMLSHHLLRAGRFKSPTEELSITLDPATLVRELATVAAENLELHSMLDMLSPDRVLRVGYDDLFSGPAQRQKTLNGISTFLGVSPLADTAPKRTGIAPLRYKIANYDACAAALGDTPFAGLMPADLDRPFAHPKRAA